jgi:hypothetical protein
MRFKTGRVRITGSDIYIKAQGAIDIVHVAYREATPATQIRGRASGEVCAWTTLKANGVTMTVKLI